MKEKLCECGCGQIAPIVKNNSKDRRYVKGEYYRFIKGHENRGRKQSPEVIAKKREYMKGHFVSEETKKKISENHKRKGVAPPEKFRFKPGHNTGEKEQNPAWKGGKTVTNGYLCTYAPEDTRSHQNGYLYEHRVIAENKLGRALKPDEVVHHIDGDKQNNNPDNLEVFPTQSDHIKHHVSIGDIDFSTGDFDC